VLLDECIDWRLGRELASREVKTARQMGWTTLKNGELLVLASAQFDVFVTVDRNLSFQQDIVSLLYCRRCVPGENQPTRRSQAPLAESPLGHRGHSAGHGEIYRPALEQMALNLRCPFVTPAKGSRACPWLEQGDERRSAYPSKWSKPALARHIDDLVLRSHQYRGSPELTARRKGPLRWTADIRAAGLEQRHEPVDRVSYRAAGIVHR
jgi:hypothetical protein